MTVPLSGILTMEGLAQEALYGTYGTGTITSPIHMYDLVNGGNSAGSGNSYPAVNQNCTPNPADRSPLPLPYMYVSPPETAATGPFTYYYNGNIGNASNLAPGDYLYTNSALTTPVVGTGPSGTDFWQDGNTHTIIASQRHCGDECNWQIYISTTGMIESYSFYCHCP